MYFGNLDESTSLFLLRLIDGPENELTIFVTPSVRKEPAKEDISAVEDEKLREILENCTEIAPDYSQLYKIHFSNYIMYQVGNESFASYDPDEIRIGKSLILFEKSRFLDSLPMYSDAFDDGDFAFPGEFRHYGVYTHNHLLDIISHTEPTIERISQE